MLHRYYLIIVSFSIYSFLLKIVYLKISETLPVYSIRYYTSYNQFTIHLYSIKNKSSFRNCLFLYLSNDDDDDNEIIIF
jgi:hypothetical protein